MWLVLILFAALLLSNAVFLLSLLFLGPAFIFPIIIGYALSHLIFFLLLVVLAIYYTRRKA
jgi:hypothetical protein